MIFQLSNTLDTHFYTAHYIPSTCIVVDGCYENVENGAFFGKEFYFSFIFQLLSLYFDAKISLI